MKWPAWEKLTTAQRDFVNNGLGPEWLPGGLRDGITKISEIFFKDAAWAHHDYGYLKGGSEFKRWYCDFKFGQAMVKDALRARWLAIPALVFALTAYLLTAVFGWRAFYYGKQEPDGTFLQL